MYRSYQVKTQSFNFFCSSLKTLILFSNSVSLLFHLMQQIRRSSVDKSGSKTNHCNLQQNVFMSRDESMVSVVCPKPRRVGILANNVVCTFRLHSRYTIIKSLLFLLSLS